MPRNNLHARLREPVVDGGGLQKILRIPLANPAYLHGILQPAALSQNLMVPGDPHFEDKHMVPLLFSRACAVHIQRHLLLIAVDLNLRLLLRPVRIPAAAQMDEGLIAPPGLVRIERVLLHPAVHGHQTLVVLAVISRLVPSVRAEVEHIPHIGAPQMGHPVEHPQHIFVVQRLELFGIVPLLRRRRLQAVEGVRAVLREAYAPVRVSFVEFLKEGVIILKLPFIPSEVQIIRKDVGNVVQRTVHGEHIGVGHGCQPGTVHGMSQIVQNTMVFQQILRHAAHADLVGQRPQDDGGVVIILGDELPHLGHRVGPPSGHMYGNVGNLRPYDQAPAVAQIVKIPAVLIVGQAHGGSAGLQNQLHVQILHLPRNGIPHPRKVLMPRHAPERIGFPVQEESPLRIKGKGAASEIRPHPVRRHAVHCQLRIRMIQIRILPSVP